MTPSFGTMRPKKRLALAPMIDVVFLLLVFFMLASQFGRDRAVPFSMPGAGGAYDGPPRLVRVTAGGLTLNGVPAEASEIAGRLRDLVKTGADPIVLQADETATLQNLMDIASLLTAAGFSGLVIIE